MASSNTAAPASQPTVEPTTFVSKVIAHLWEAYEFVISAMMTVIYTLMQPYVSFYNLTKSFYDNFRDLIKIGTLSIHAAHLYLQVWIRFLHGLNKDDKPAETVIATVKNIGTAVNNIYRRLQDEPERSPTRRSESSGSTTFPPIMEVDESSSDHDYGSNGNGQQLEETSSPPGNANQHRPAPSRNGSGNGGGGSNGGSNGSGSGGTGGNGSTQVNGYDKPPARSQTVTFDPNVKGAPASSGSTTGSSSTGPTAQTNSGAAPASSQQGVDEVDKSDKAKTSPKQTPATPPASGGTTLRATRM